MAHILVYHRVRATLGEVCLAINGRQHLAQDVLSIQRDGEHTDVIFCCPESVAFLPGVALKDLIMRES